MATNFYWVQNGGGALENDDAGHCFYPAPRMMPKSCAVENGYPEIDHCHTPPTAGHRGGGGSYANSRILDFVEPDFCRIHCLEDRPRKCEEDIKCLNAVGSTDGWPNQEGLWDYYCRDIHPVLAEGDCFVTHIVPAREDFHKFYFQVLRPVEGLQVQFKLLCGGIDLSPVIDAGVCEDRIQFTTIPDENRLANLCDGFDIIVMEIVALPPEAIDDPCKDGIGKIEGLSIMGSVHTCNICTGK